MKEYTSDTLRNVAVVAHDGAGKTSLTEALLFNAGAVNRLGRVDDGAAVADFEPEEVKRKVTISAALAPCEWKESKINFIDTPGYVDFVAEVKGALRAADHALLVLCAAAGVEVETEKVWQYAKELDLPRMAFINKMDRENADFFRVIDMMKTAFGPSVVPLQIPIGSEENFRGVVDLLSMKALLVHPQGTQFEETVIPDELLPQAAAARQTLVEAVAETDDDLLSKYLEGEELTGDEISAALLRGIAAARLFPVLCGSAYHNIGIRSLLDAVVAYLPPAAARTVYGCHPATQAVVERKPADSFSALVFKTMADPFVGRLSYIRVFSGQLKQETTVYNASKDKHERIGHIFSLRGKHQEALSCLVAGDIAVVAKLQETGTGDSLCDKEQPIVFPPIAYPTPMFTLCMEAKNQGDDDKIGHALQRLSDEDPTLYVHKDLETAQLAVSVMGELHADIMVERLKRKFGVEVLLCTPKAPYRETIRGSVKVEGKHKKQSGGHGQYGHVWLQLDPLPAGGGFEFVDAIFGGAVPRQYIPAVEKGVREALHGGVLAGCPLVDVKVSLCDGSYHSVDSSEMAFRIASVMALRKGALQARPVLLEPIYAVEVTAPEGCMGDIIGDLNGKRGRIQGMESVGDGQGVVKAQVPLAEMFKYAIDLRSLAHGRGTFVMSFSHCEEVPQRIAEEIIANAKKTRDGEA